MKKIILLLGFYCLGVFGTACVRSICLNFQRIVKEILKAMEIDRFIRRLMKILSFLPCDVTSSGKRGSGVYKD